MLKNTRQTYGWVAIVVHWLMALAIFALFALGLWMTDLNYYDAWYHRAPDIHKSVGMLLLFLLFFRMAWVAVNAKPDIIGLAWERFIALIVHRMHYALMLLVMLSGYLIPTAKGEGVSVFGWFSVPAAIANIAKQADIAGFIHFWGAWAMIGLAALHTAAALKHHFIDKDATLTRMLGMTNHKDTKAQRS
ncbi:MAG: cytochrome b [Mariprofundaceae bacterium]